MFSERQRDGIERDPEQYFKRYNAKAPEKGGARKGYGPNAGQTLSRSERAADLVALRGRWEAMANQHLEHAGIEARIDMRSHADRGLEYAPEAKKLPSQWRDQEQRGQVLEFRAARIEQQRAMAELGQVVPDLKGELTAQIIDIRTAAVARQEKAHAGAPEKPQVAQKATGRGEEALPASARIRRLLADLQDLRAEREESPRQAAEATQRPAPAPAVPVDPQRLAAVVERDSQVWQARQKLEPLERDRQQLQHQEQLTARAVEAWRTAHPWRAKMHDSGAMKSVELERLAQQMEATRERIEQHKPVLEQAKAALQQARAEAEPHALVVLQEQDRETRGYLEHELAKQREADAGGPRRDGPGPSMD
ncbi:Ti-type conjugative transfer relaxase TraA [compost metagenome]